MFYDDIPIGIRAFAHLLSVELKCCEKDVKSSTIHHVQKLYENSISNR